MNVNGVGTVSDTIAGINHVVSKCNGVSGALCVANISLGKVAYNEAFNMAVNNAVTKGVVMVVAAGNDNQDACTFSPSSAISAITVGSTTIDDVRSSFSNWGSCVDVYAPGTDITSSWYTSPTATATYSGTSMASPRKLSFIVDVCCHSSINASYLTLTPNVDLLEMLLVSPPLFDRQIHPGILLKFGMP